MNSKPTLFRKSALLLVAGAAAIAVPMAGVLPGDAAVAQSQGDRLDRATRALRGISTMKANFTQTDRNGNAMRGELTLKNPGKIRFEYTNDANMLVVSDGRALSVIDYDVNQVDRWPVNNSPLGALLDPNRDIRRYGSVVNTTESGVTSIRVRDPGRPEYGTMTLVFLDDSSAPGGLRLDSWVALDSQGTRTTVRLRNHRFGVSVPDSAFTFRDPRRSSRRPR